MNLQTSPTGPKDASQESMIWFLSQQATPSDFGEPFFVNSLQDPRCSTNSGEVDYWRRLSGHGSPSNQTFHLVSSVDIQRLWQQPAFLSLLKWGGTWPVAASIESPFATDLFASLRDFDDLPMEADEEGFPQPSPLALTTARRLLHDIYRLRPSRLDVYPTPDGEVALAIRGSHRRSVLILCGSDGRVLCSVNLDGNHRRASYDDAVSLPDGFVREAVHDLGESEHAW